MREDLAIFDFTLSDEELRAIQRALVRRGRSVAITTIDFAGGVSFGAPSSISMPSQRRGSTASGAA